MSAALFGARILTKQNDGILRSKKWQWNFMLKSK